MQNDVSYFRSDIFVQVYCEKYIFLNKVKFYYILTNDNGDLFKHTL